MSLVLWIAGGVYLLAMAVLYLRELSLLRAGRPSKVSRSGSG
jgi:hypothetical protein